MTQHFSVSCLACSKLMLVGSDCIAVFEPSYSLQGIQQRQKKLLSSPESSWEVACARLADDACLQLRKVLMPSRTTSWRVTWGLLAGVLVVGAAAVALVVAQAEEESWDRFLQNQAVCYDACILVLCLADPLQPRHVNVAVSATSL